jgi:hypothetical protein
MMSNTQGSTTSVAIVTPVYNDWDSFVQLVEDIDREIAEQMIQVHIIAVNDNSFHVLPNLGHQLRHIKKVCSIDVLHLYTNVGHQRAIAIGLVEIAHQGSFDAVFVMDADGEDRPADMNNMLALHQQYPDRVIVAQRSKRSESWVFRVFYTLYKLLFGFFVGKVIDFGNYCLIPASRLDGLVYDSNIWNHLASTLVRHRPEVQRMRTIRGTRYAGQSSMNLESLVSHGLSAISVHIEKVLIRLLLGATLLLIIASLGVAVVVWVRFFTGLAIPGWATTAAGLLVIVILQLLILALGAVFGIFNRRATMTFVPALEAQKYVKQRESIIYNV